MSNKLPRLLAPRTAGIRRCSAGLIAAFLFLVSVLSAPAAPGRENGKGDAVSGATMSTEKAWRNQEPVELDGVEVREYEGENLSLINRSFRENSIKGPQYVDKDAYRLSLETGGAEPRTLSYGEVLEHSSYSKVVTLYCVEGWDAKILWEGVLVEELLGLSGSRNAAVGAGTVVKFFAADGYSTSLPLSFILENDLLLAYKMNGVTLPPERGFPFQLVAEDKWGYKWIKWVTRIRVDNDTAYRGYWESRGYSDEGDLDEPFFD